MTLTPAAFLLTDRVVVVTGAAQGIGRATALSCAAFGADVAICDRDVDGLERTAADVYALGRRAVTAVLDVRDGGAVTDHLGQVRDALGQVDVLVNNAGGGFVSPFLDITDRGQQALVDENFTSVTHFIRGCVPLMPSTGGSIVNITSIEAHRAAPGFGIYAAMKAAIENLSRTLALEFADRRIRVNCIAVDAVPTAGHTELSEDVGMSPWDYEIPWPELGVPDDVAAAVIYLATDASRIVTGTTLHVDGGTNASRGWRRDGNGRWRP